MTNENWSGGYQLRSPFLLANEHCGEQGNGQFMMTRDRISLAGALFGRTSHDVCQRTVRLYEIEVCGRDVRQWIAEVPHQRHAFQKYFRQHDCRSNVEINSAAVHLFH